MKSVDACMKALVDAVKESLPYRSFTEAKTNIRCHPEKKEQIDAFRKRVFLVQNDNETFDRLGEMNILFQEREKLMQDPLIADYLSTEAELCRMLQKICFDVMNSTDLQIDPFEDSFMI